MAEIAFFGTLMNILSLDTSTDLGSAAILQESRVLALRATRAPMRHLSWLAPAMLGLLDEAKLSWDDLDAIAVGIGPGSFTGVRLQLATAKTLAQVRGIPVYGISSLDALATQGLPFQGTIVSTIDAKRGELYAGIYSASSLKFHQQGPYLCTSKESLAASLGQFPPPYLFIGETNPYLSFLLKALPNSSEAPDPSGSLLASSLGVLAYQRQKELSGDPFKLAPLYLRLSSAEIEKEKAKVAAR